MLSNGRFIIDSTEILLALCERCPSEMSFLFPYNIKDKVVPITEPQLLSCSAREASLTPPLLNPSRVGGRLQVLELENDFDIRLGVDARRVSYYWFLTDPAYVEKVVPYIGRHAPKVESYFARRCAAGHARPCFALLSSCTPRPPGSPLVCLA